LPHVDGHRRGHLVARVDDCRPEITRRTSRNRQQPRASSGRIRDHEQCGTKRYYDLHCPLRSWKQTAKNKKSPWPRAARAAGAAIPKQKNPSAQHAAPKGSHSRSQCTRLEHIDFLLFNAPPAVCQSDRGETIGEAVPIFPIIRSSCAERLSKKLYQR